MKKIFKYFLKDERGTTAVEFGLISIAFITLLFGLIETGRFILAWNAFQYTIETSARAAITSGENLTDDELADAIKTHITEQLSTFLMSSENALIVATFPESIDGNVEFVEIDATYTYNIIVPLLPESWSTYNIGAKTKLVRQ